MTTRVRSVLVVAALAILAVEAALHALGGRLPEEFAWTAADRVPQMERLRDSGLATDIAFVGTSMILVGARNEVFAADSHHVRNAGVGGAGIDLNRRWVSEFVLPLLRPDTLVWGIGSFEFNEIYSDETLVEQFEDTRVGKPGIIGELDRVLGSVSALSRHRDQLRGPLSVIHLFDPPRPALTVDELMGSGPYPTGRTPRKLEIVTDQMLVGYSLSAAKTALFEETVAGILEQEVGVVLVIMPVPSDYVMAHPAGESDYAEFVTWAAAAAARLGVPLLDYGRSYPDDQFDDYTHLGPSGSAAFSHDLSADLVVLGSPAP